MISWIKQHKIVSLLCLIVLISTTAIINNSYISAWFLKSWFEEQGSQVELDDLTLSFWNSKLDIVGLKATDLNGNKLIIQSLTLEWVVADLWNKRLSIPAISLEGFRSTLVGEEGAIQMLGPINLDKMRSAEMHSNQSLANQSQSEIKQELQAELTQQEPTQWSFSLGPVNVSDVNLCYRDLKLNYDALGLPLNKASNNLEACLAWESLSLDTQLLLEPNSVVNIEGDIKLNEFGVQDDQGKQLIHLKELLLNNVTFDSQIGAIQQLVLEDLKFLSQSADSELADSGLSFNYFEIKQFNWQAKNNMTSFQALSLDALKLYHRAFDDVIHKLSLIESIVMQEALFEDNEVKIQAMQFDGIDILENFQPPLSDMKVQDYLAKLSQVRLGQLHLSGDSLSLGQLDLDGLKMHMEKHEAGINLNNWFPVNEPIEEKDSKSEEPESSKSNDLIIDVANINIGEQSSLTFVDYIEQKPTVHSLSDIKVALQNLHIGPETKEKAAVSLSAKLGKHGMVSAKGIIIPAPGNPLVDLGGELTNVELVNLTDYSARLIGYRVERGLLNLKYTFKLADNKLDSHFETLFEKFELAALQKHEESPLNKELGIPLPMALDLIRDSDDNIELELPVSGDIDDPDLSISSIVSTVSMKAVKNAIIYHYSPLGMLSLASGIFDLATALRFEPLVFEYGTTQLTLQAKEQLDKVAKIMHEKPKVKFLICATATEADWINHKLPEPSQKAAKNLAANIEVDVKALIDLANERQGNTIDYLVQEHKIEPVRLLTCNIKLSSDKNYPAKVNVSI